MSEKNLVLYRNLTHRGDDNAISWKAHPSFPDLGQIGQGKFDNNLLATIVSAHRGGYVVEYAEHDAAQGIVEVSRYVRSTIEAALAAS
jgi:hypothetical protein